MMMRPPSYTAIHEAGHAVVARSLGARVSMVTAVADHDLGAEGRFCGFLPYLGDVAAHVLAELTISLAGRAAERRARPRSARAHIEAGAAKDIESTLRRLAPLDPLTRSRALFAANRQALEMVDEHWLAICRVAAELDERGAISGVMLGQVMAEARDEWVTISTIEPGITGREYVGRMTLTQTAG